jgi:hypothetical protein
VPNDGLLAKYDLEHLPDIFICSAVMGHRRSIASKAVAGALI